MSSLCIDIDNVLARTDEVMRRVICDFTNGRVNFKYEQIIQFDYWKCKDGTGCTVTKNEWNSIHELFSEPRYLWMVQPEPGVQDCLKLLAAKFDIHLATSRLPKARRQTIEWLDNHGFPPHDLHFLKHGEKHVSLGKFAAAVEDHYEQAVEFANCGTPSFLLQHPWNRGKPQADKLKWVNDWSDLTKQLVSLVAKE
jgi:5'(3')-deoxyribonucleotidase